MYCSHCGKEIPEDSKFCCGCGVAVEQSAESVELAPSESVVSLEPARKKPKDYVYAILIALGLLVRELWILLKTMGNVLLYWIYRLLTRNAPVLQNTQAPTISDVWSALRIWFDQTKEHVARMTLGQRKNALKQAVLVVIVVCCVTGLVAQTGAVRVSSSGSSSSSNGFWDRTVPFQPEFSKLDCLTCGGDGDCNTCGGYGEVERYAGAGDTVTSKCSSCYGSGNCRTCGGSGKR